MHSSGCGPEDFEEGLSQAIGQARKIFRQVYTATGMAPGHAGPDPEGHGAERHGAEGHGAEFGAGHGFEHDHGDFGPRFAYRRHVRAGHGFGPGEDFGPGHEFAAEDDYGPGPDFGPEDEFGAGDEFGPGPAGSSHGHHHGPGPGHAGHGHHHGPGTGHGERETAGGPWGAEGFWGMGGPFGFAAKDWMGLFGGPRGGRRQTRPAPPWGPGRPGGFGPPRRPKASRGDVRATILALLSEGPRTGYQIMSDIEERSGGAWRPSPGAVYPALAQLADEELIIGAEADGKRTYSLTDAGRDYVASHPEMARGAWESMTQPGPGELPGLFGEAARLGVAIMQMAHAGTPEQVREAERLLEQTRRTLYQFLADEAEDADDADEADDDPSAGPGE
jgi:DNA-binding PadR family transcriptional regulator